MSNDNTHLYQLSHAETFNKYMLTIASSSFPVLGYFIKDEKGWVIGFKISMLFFALSLFLTMLVLFISVDTPEPKGWLERFIYGLDWISFIFFSVALFMAYLAILFI